MCENTSVARFYRFLALWLTLASIARGFPSPEARCGQVRGPHRQDEAKSATPKVDRGQGVDKDAARSLGFDPVRLGRLDALIQDRIDAAEAIGAVVVVARDGRSVYRRAFGARALVPRREEMPVDAVFDLASLTKVVATTSCVLELVEDGRVDLAAPLSRYLPELADTDKADITVEQALRHRGGFVADNPLADYLDGPDLARRRVYTSKLIAGPGEVYRYSDVGFILLGWLVEKVTGVDLAVHARKRFFEPLGMRDTGFLPVGGAAPAWADRCVPTEPAEAGSPPLRGVVHDPRARRLGGVAGHAGLFSTADDLARFGAMLLFERGDSGSRPGLGALSVRSMIRVPDLPPAERRGLGWDLRPRAANPLRPGGDRFPDDGFGHTGFTGTSIWLDPRSRTVVIVLTSRLHPAGGKRVSGLRRAVADQVAVSLRDRPWPLPSDRREGVRTGIDRVSAGAWPQRWRGKRVGLITNHTGMNRDGESTAEILSALPEVELRALFSPEHGFRGRAETRVDDSIDPTSGIVVHSLYGENRRPTARQLRDLDVLVFDIQDIGARFYTYLSTMVGAMEEAARHGLAFAVLDRPNPVGGIEVGGPVADAAALDFVGALRIPVRHGMTLGELARLARKEKGLDLDLEVIWMAGWRRGRLFDDTGLPWVNPSPNMRSLDQALLYPGVALLEFTNVSVGRGTDLPFEKVGAPWMDGEALAERLNAKKIPGLGFRPTRFTPTASRHAGKSCQGIRIVLLDRAAVDPLRGGLEIALALVAEHAKEWDSSAFDRLLKHRASFSAVRRGAAFAEIEALWRDELGRFLDRRAACLIYDD